MARGRAPGYDDQRQDILHHAARLFARRGYAGTSMNQVAEAAGLSKASLYHYFRDKYALLVSIAESHVAALETMVAEVEAAGAPPPERMRELIVRIIGAYAGAQDHHRVLTEDVRYLEPDDRERILGHERRVVEAFARTIAAWQPGHAEAGLAKPLTMLLFGMINWMFIWLKPDGDLTHETMAPIVADLFSAGVPAIRPPERPVKGRSRAKARGTDPFVMSGT